MHPAVLVALRHLLVNDPAPGGHPLHVACADDATDPHAIGMPHCSRQDVRDRLDSAVRVPREARQVILRTVIAEVREEEEGVEAGRIVETERAAQPQARAFKRRLGFTESFNRSNGHIGSPTRRNAPSHETIIISKLLGGIRVRKHALIIHSKKNSGGVSIQVFAVRLTNGGRQMRYMMLNAGEIAEDIDLELSSKDYPTMNGILKQPCDEGVILASPIAAPCRQAAKPWILTATILASSMAFIDGTVVNVALGALQREFNATLVGVQWVVEAYALFLASLVLVGGSLGDL